MVNIGPGPEFCYMGLPIHFFRGAASAQLHIQPTIACRNIFLHHQQVSTRITLTLLVSWVTLGPPYNLVVWRILAVSYITCAALKHAEVSLPSCQHKHILNLERGLIKTQLCDSFEVLSYIQRDKAKTFLFKTHP